MAIDSGETALAIVFSPIVSLFSGVSMMAGITAFARSPLSRSSSARTSVSLITPAFETE
ncbi:MAG: hypothetical protein WD276_01780 [Actinomycetota bacterium]